MDRLNSFKLFLDNHKNKIIFLSILLVLLTVSVCMFLNLSKFKQEEQVVFSDSKDLIDKIEEKKENDECYFVDVKGAVNNPGVYCLSKDKRVVDAINVAGGLTSNADTSLLNLSMSLEDEMIIRVYYKDEVINSNEEKDLNINSESKINKNPITKKEEVKNEITSNESKKININTSSKSELMTLSKIGEVKANQIIEYRNTHGMFKTIEDIKNVKGIGDSLFETIKNNITI